MSDHTQLPQDQVEAYLARLRKSLAGLPADDIEEVVREIGGHIAERAANSDSGESKMPIEQVLHELGTPEHIGSLYRTDALVAHARASFSPALIIRTTIRWATTTAVGFAAFMVGVAGYATGLAFIVCAILKPFMPDQVGLWIGPSGFVLGFTTSSPHNTELLGWWLIPTGFAMGASFFLGTTAFLRWMLRFAPRASRRVASVA